MPSSSREQDHSRVQLTCAQPPVSRIHMMKRSRYFLEPRKTASLASGTANKLPTVQTHKSPIVLILWPLHTLRTAATSTPHNSAASKQIILQAKLPLLIFRPCTALRSLDVLRQPAEAFAISHPAHHTAHEDLDWPHARILQLNLALATGVVLQPKC